MAQQMNGPLTPAPNARFSSVHKKSFLQIGQDVTRVVHIVTGGLAALIGVVTLIQAVTGLAFLGANGEPGPAFFPAILSGGLIVLGLTLALGYLLRPESKLANREQLNYSAPTLLRAGSVWLTLALAVALMTTLGFLLSSILMVAVLVLVIERLRGFRTVSALLALPVGIYVLFAVLLDVRLPTGIFGA